VAEFYTAGSIVSDAALELGLVNVAIADPYSSTDPNIVRLCSLLKTLGRKLRRRRQWNHLRQTTVFTLTANQPAYAPPPDYDRYIDQTGWNRTNRLPLGGPLSAQDLEFLRARLVGVVFTVLFDFLKGQFLVYPDTSTPGGYTIAYEYMSRWWVAPAIPQWTQGAVFGRLNLSPQSAWCQNGGHYYVTFGGGTAGASPPTGTGNAGISDGGVTWYYAPLYAASTAYGGGGSQSAIAVANGQLFEATTPGTTGTGTMPLSTGSGIVDGTAAWTWIGPGYFPTVTIPSPAFFGPGAIPLVPMSDAPALSTDTLMFDALMLTKGLELAFRDANGWAVSQAMLDEYKDVENGALDNDSQAKVLSLDTQSGGDPLLGERNVPLTGFGS
jgi:hypothetical protein